MSKNDIKKYFNRGISTPIAFFVIILLAIVVGVGAWYFSKNQVPASPSINPTSTDQLTVPPTPSPSPELTYCAKLGLEIKDSINEVNDCNSKLDCVAVDGIFDDNFPGGYFLVNKNEGLGELDDKIDSFREHCNDGINTIKINTDLENDIKESTRCINNKCLFTYHFVGETEVADTDDWRYYFNEDMDFEFKFNPSGIENIWYAGDVSIVFPSFIADIMVREESFDECINNPWGLTSTGLKQKIDGVDFHYFINYNSPDIGAYCGMHSGCTAVDVYQAFYKDKCYKIKLRTNSPPPSENDIKLFNQIFQTFNFEEYPERWSVYKNKDLEFEFKIAPLFEENGCTIAEFDYPYYFDDNDEECFSLAFETMPIEPVGWVVDPNEPDEMFHINICSIDYCEGDGEENCNYIRTGGFIDGDWPVWTQYITENDKYFIYALTGSSYGDHLDSRGWNQERIRELRTKMLNSIRFIDDLPVGTKKQWMEEEMDTGCDYTDESLRDRNGVG